MQINQLQSSANSIVKRARGLASGACKGSPELFLIEGRKLLEEAYAKNVRIESVIASQSFFQNSLKSDPGKLDQIKELNLVEDSLFKQMCSTVSSCGIVALGSQQEWRLENLLLTNSDRPLVIADQIQDPGNLGTMIRTALAFKAAGLIIAKGTVDHFSPKVVRASMGAIFDLPIVYADEMSAMLDILKKARIEIIALDGQGEHPFWLASTSQSAAYVFGNEGNGLSSLVLDKADKIVNIPISAKTESLNVAVAMGIVLCHLNNARI